jgi:hypothetical protein
MFGCQQDDVMISVALLRRLLLRDCGWSGTTPLVLAILSLVPELL